MRITGGQWKGRSLSTPTYQKARPTSAKVRQAIFNLLPDVTRSNVLDICCGTGSLGLEALSRGADSCMFIDIDTKLVRENIRQLNCLDRTVVLKKDIRRLKSTNSFDLIFLDPPYGKGLVEIILSQIKQEHLLNQGGLIVAENEISATIDGIDFNVMKRREYGDTCITILHY